MDCADPEANKGLYSNPKEKINAGKGFWKKLC